MRSPSGGISVLGYLERLRILGIEALCESARQFKMLPLVLANQNAVSLVEQYVGSLQRRLGEQAGTTIGNESEIADHESGPRRQLQPGSSPHSSSSVSISYFILDPV